ncbi:hypothetical protein ABZT02_37530 [Streptomyces sp. NPDC005402]|uniref:hypothetical protein n=1 Tax=Streptomyces sp. NPDC005402 TaxID=3155338 RepID=UPI00339E2A63
MARRAGRGGGAVRWAYGVIVLLRAALAGLVHHEVSATGASPTSLISGIPQTVMPAMVHAAHGVPREHEPSFSGSATRDLSVPPQLCI